MSDHKMLTFEQVLPELKKGRKAFRTSWNGNHLTVPKVNQEKGEVEYPVEVRLLVQAQFPDEHSKMGNPYLYIDATALGGTLNPWVPSQTDLFADDWILIYEGKK